MVAVLDREGRLVEVNPALLRMLGHSKQELIGRPVALIVAPEAYEATATRLARQFDGTELASLDEVALLTGDGRRVPTEVSSQVILHDELPVGVLMIARDVRERVAARAALEESERRLRGVFDGVAVGMAFTDPAAALLRVNAAFAEMLGYSPSELTGVPVRELVHPDDRAVFAADIEKLRGRLGPRRVVADRRYLRKDGETIFVHVSVSAVRGADGSTQFLAAQVEDVTELQRVQAALAESQALHGVVIESSPDVLAVLDLDGTIRLVSPSIQASLGYSEQELVGRNLVELLHPADRQTAQAAFEAAGGGRTGSLNRLQVVAKSGAVRVWEGTVAPGAVNGDELTFLVANARDVTNRVELEDQLRQAQKMEAVGRLAGGVAHDFNNLLTVIRGYAELGLRKLDGGDGSAEIEGVMAAADKAGSLTAQLLAFSRRQVLKTETFDLGDVAAAMVELLRRLIGENVELTTVLPNEPTFVHADRAQIEQVVVNLAVNASDAMPDGGSLSIEVARTADQRQALLVVRDDGAGMDALTAAQIFEPFFTTKGQQGTGLGLAMVSGIISQSGGQIAVESEPGQGTTFTISLPRADGVAAPAEPVAATPAAGGAETILLVEDDPAVRAVVTSMLDQRGYRLVTAAGGEEALALARATPGTVDLLITDLMMGGLNGRETAEAVREHQPQAKVLYMSGYTDAAVIRVSGHESRISFLQKPFSGDELARRVRELLDTNTA